MIASLVKKSWVLALLGITAAAVLFIGGNGSSRPAQAASPGATVAPLLSCPNVDGSVDNGVRVADILSVVQAYFKDYPISGGEPAGTSDYVFMYDLANPYNPQTGTGGQQRVDDILAVVSKYFQDCPVVDTQVAQAVRWAIDTDPGTPGNQPVPQLENTAALEALHYYQSTTDVPGQGVHYINLDNWDGVFNPAAPEGLVYANGRLAAQLYVADAPTVGIGTHAPNPCSVRPDTIPPIGPDYYQCDAKIAGVELETAGDGPQCDPACSWSGPETWHLHYYLCTVGVGTTAAIAIPGSFVPEVGDSQTDCANYAASQGSGTQCTVPVTTQPCYNWSLESGWMGHLYAWYPNANRIPDVNATMNGRFSDCFPDVEGWKSTNCPG